MVGSAILRLLKKRGFQNILIKSKKQLDLTNQKTYDFLKRNKPDYVIIAAALVGGIKKNIDLKPEFLIKNSLIASNLIHGSYLAKIKNLLFLGSSCVYPGNLKKKYQRKFF